MWRLAAESLIRFPEVIVTAMSNEGYPVSVRQRSPRYDGRTGEMPVRIPESVAVAAGPANILAHYHDEKLWNLHMMQIKGYLEKRQEDWVFVSTAFTPPAQGQLRSLWQMAKAMRSGSRRYLAMRRLERPRVNWAVVKRLQRQARFGPMNEPCRSKGKFRTRDGEIGGFCRGQTPVDERLRRARPHQRRNHRRGSPSSTRIPITDNRTRRQCRMLGG